MSASERFGTACFSSTNKLVKAGLVSNGGLHHGYTFEKHPQQIGYDADTASILIGAAGTGKFSTHFAYQLLHPESTAFLDMKGEAAATTGMTQPDCDCYFFNPYGLWTDAPWFLPASHRFNILDFVDSNSPMLFEDMLTIALDGVSKPKGGGASEHFYGKAVEVLTAVLVSTKDMNPNASLIDCYNVLGDMRGSGGDDHFASLHYPVMMASSYSAVQKVAQEMMEKREKAPGEFEGILSTISNSLKILGSPALQRVLSGKSTITMPQLVASERPVKFYIMIPVHLVESCAGIIRMLISTLTIAQQRNPKMRLNIIIDEAGQLGNFTTLCRLYSFGRGSKCRVHSAWQNIGQGFDNLGKDAFDTVFANAQSKIILGIASEHSAKFISDYLGKQTYEYESYVRHGHAKLNQARTMREAMTGKPLNEILPDIAKDWQISNSTEAVSRALMTPDELIHMPPDQGLLDFHSLGVRPYLYQKRHYFENPDIVHRFLPNPFHPPYDRVMLPIRWGRKKSVPIISEPVPDEIAQRPQYAQGMWSYPRGYCPLKRKRRWFGFKG